MRALKIVFTIMGFAFAVYSLWYLSHGYTVVDWQEYARSCFGVLTFLGIMNLVVQVWR